MARYKADYRILSPTKKGGFYYYRDGNDPKRIRRSTGQKTERGAREYLNLLRKQKLDSDEDKKDLTFGHYAQGFFGPDCPYLLRKKQEGREVNAKTVQDYKAYVKNYLVPAFGAMKLTDINAQCVRSWREKILKGEIKVPSMANRRIKSPNPRTLNYVLSCFRAMTEQAEEDGLILKDPLLRVKNLPVSKDSPHDALTVEEIKKLFGDTVKLWAIWGSTQNIALFFLLFGSGLRSGEVRALQWGDVDFERHGILVQHAIKADGSTNLPKNKKPRAITLPGPVLDWLKTWDKESKDHDPEDLVFPGAGLRIPRSRSAILMTFKRALKTCGINRDGLPLKLVVHSSRHSWNTLLVDKGQDGLARSLLGHGSAEMTAIYNHTTLQKDLDKLTRTEGVLIDEVWKGVLRG